MKKLALLAIGAALLVVACDAEVKREPQPSYAAQRDVDCNYSGFCWGRDSYGDGEYSYSFHWMCDGKQLADVTLTPYKVTYESGKSSMITESHVDRVVGQCH